MSVMVAGRDGDNNRWAFYYCRLNNMKYDASNFYVSMNT